jgi:hypothetical protein
MSPQLSALLARLKGGRKTAAGWQALCPAHADTDASLSIAEGAAGCVLLKCFAGCRVEMIVAAVNLEMRDLFPSERGEDSSAKGVTPIHRSPEKTGAPRLRATDTSTVRDRGTGDGLTLESLAAAKHLDRRFLLSLGIDEVRRSGAPAIRIPYVGSDGRVEGVRFRLALAGARRFCWRQGDRVAVYGLDRLPEVQAAGWVMLVEGETDCWTAWHYGLPALGVPGKATWKLAWREHLTGLAAYLWQEPGAEDFTRRVARDVPNLHVIVAPEGIKDLSEAHCQGQDVRALIEQLKRQAVPGEQIVREAADAKLVAVRASARAVLDEDDPLVRIVGAIQALGYGGAIGPAIITYLALTSRVLAMRPGTMPVHLLLVGQPSAGKSYTLQTALRLFPPEAYHEIDAGSPRTLIYDRADLRHRALIFGEADSLPAGEDNPAASAIRNLLQEHRLRYSVTVRDNSTGEYTVREVTKLGPTVLVTSTIRRLGAQLDSRVFALDIPDDHLQIQQALHAQAELEVTGRPEPDTSLIAYQAYLQAQVPWQVVVPFVHELSEAIAHAIAPARILRDFSRLLSLIKTVCVLRHAHRQRDDRHRLIAEVDDYAAVYDLVQNMYETSVAGASTQIRQAVAKVTELAAATDSSSVSVTQLAGALGIDKMAASRRVKTAIKHGWLVNGEDRRGRPAQLTPGEPLPAQTGLPRPEALRPERNGVTPPTDEHCAYAEPARTQQAGTELVASLAPTEPLP